MGTDAVTSDGPQTPDTPPITKPPAPGTRTAAPSSAATSPVADSPPRPGVGLAALIWIGLGVIVLSFVASFLGASLARSNGASEPAPVPVPSVSESQPSTEEYEAALEEILPAGAAVRAGTGVPEAGKGYEGEVYIDISTSDVYLFKDGEWVKVGNIRASAAANLTGETGETGATGETGETGETGASGAPGTPGTQLSLGLGVPDDATCVADGDIYIDTEVVEFYECEAGTWTLFGPTPQLPAPLPTPTTDTNG